MQGKTVLITGATSGIGNQTALELAKKGASLILSSRDMQRGKEVKRELVKGSGKDDIIVYPCDFASLKSISDFAKEVAKNHEKIDVLINNAGVWEPNRKLSLDGYELTFAVNHLAPFYLTSLLLDKVKSADQGRIINVSSALHNRGIVDLKDLQSENSYDSMQVYSNTKLMNILFTRSLHEKLKNSSVTVNAVHPGFISTNLARKYNFLIKLFISIFGKNKKKGAETSVFLASDESVATISGEYFVKKKVAQASASSADMTLAKKLWEVSEQLCNSVLS